MIRCFLRIAGLTLSIHECFSRIFTNERFTPFIVSLDEIISDSFDMVINPQEFLFNKHITDLPTSNAKITYCKVDNGYILCNSFGGLVLSSYIRSDCSYLTIPSPDMVGTYGRPFFDYFFMSVFQFAFGQLLLSRSAFQLHSSAVLFRRKAILFSGQSGVGKSTQAKLWCKYASADIINHDSPIIKVDGDSIVAYGNPWSGSDKCYVNVSAPVAAIFMLKQDLKCSIQRLTRTQSFQNVLSQSLVQCRDEIDLNMLISIIDSVLDIVPTYLFMCTSTRDAVKTVAKELHEFMEDD